MAVFPFKAKGVPAPVQQPAEQASLRRFSFPVGQVQEGEVAMLFRRISQDPPERGIATDRHPIQAQNDDSDAGVLEYRLIRYDAVHDSAALRSINGIHIGKLEHSQATASFPSWTQKKRITSNSVLGELGPDQKPLLERLPFRIAGNTHCAKAS